MRRKWFRYLACVGAGVVLYLAAETVDSASSVVENGKLSRNPCGQGEAVYEFYVDGLVSGMEGTVDNPVDGGTEGQGISVVIQVPEQKLTAEQFAERLPEMVEILCERILGENASLTEVRSDLELVKEVPEFGVTVTWDSDRPEVVSSMGVVDGSAGSAEAKGNGVDGNEAAVEESVMADVSLGLDDTTKDFGEIGIQVFLEATLTNGIAEEIVEIPVVVYPPEESMEERFLAMMEELVLLEPEHVDVVLPQEFEGKKLTYHAPGHSQNLVLVFLGIVAALCLFLKEKSDLEEAKKRRENSLMEDYSDLVSEFLILTGAGYPAKAAWKKMTLDYGRSAKKGMHPLYEEMQVAVNQMETGVPETRAYADFGRRCQVRCYVKFASLLESSVSTGGKNLRRLLESEVEEAFKQRADTARRKGEELSSKLLLPMFGMLGVVMVMVVAPAFLTLG